MFRSICSMHFILGWLPQSIPFSWPCISSQSTWMLVLIEGQTRRLGILGSEGAIAKQMETALVDCHLGCRQKEGGRVGVWVTGSKRLSLARLAKSTLDDLLLGEGRYHEQGQEMILDTFGYWTNLDNQIHVWLIWFIYVHMHIWDLYPILLISWRNPKCQGIWDVDCLQVCGQSKRHQNMLTGSFWKAIVCATGCWSKKAIGICNWRLEANLPT